MKKASSNLFDLVYGELIPVESTIFGKMCFIFYTVEDNLKSKILYYPSTKEVKTLRSLENEFSEFIPLHRDEFIKPLITKEQIKESLDIIMNAAKENNISTPQDANLISNMLDLDNYLKNTEITVQ